jgi:hypothetical protein
MKVIPVVFFWHSARYIARYRALIPQDVGNVELHILVDRPTAFRQVAAYDKTLPE